MRYLKGFKVTITLKDKEKPLVYRNITNITHEEAMGDPDNEIMYMDGNGLSTYVEMKNVQSVELTVETRWH